MGIFNIFRGKAKVKILPDNVKIEFGFRGENLTYQKDDRKIELQFTWTDGFKIYPDDIKKWKDGDSLTEQEKEAVFVDTLKFIKSERGKSIVVINIDDTSKDLWEKLCSENESFIEKIEYTSDKEVFQFKRDYFFQSFKRGNKIIMNDKEINNEEDLNILLSNLEDNFRKSRGR